jgi:hypothetical protein
MDSFFDSNVSDSSSVEEKIRKLTEKIIKNPEDYISYKEQARLLLNNNPNEGRAKIALGSLEKFLEKEPEDIESNCLVVRALRLQGNLDGALSMAERLKTKFQNTATIYEELGRIQYEKENYDSALEILSTSYTKYNDERIARALVLTLLKVKKIDQALTICNQLLDKKPNDVRTTYEKIKILVFTNKHKEALDLGEFFLDEFPDESNEIMYGPNDQPMTFEIQLASIYQIAARKILREEKSQHLFLFKNDQNKIFVKNDLGPKAQSLFEKSLFHIDNSISDRSQYNWENALDIKQKSLVFLEKFLESLVLLDELLQNRQDFALKREKIFVLFCLNRYNEVLKISEQYLTQLPTSKFIRKLKLASLQNLDKNKEFENEKRYMLEYRNKQDPKKPKQDLLMDGSINFTENTAIQARDSVRKLEKELRKFLRKNLTRDMFQELEEGKFKSVYKSLEKKRESRKQMVHQSKKLLDFWDETDLGTLYFAIVYGKKLCRKGKYEDPDSKLLKFNEDHMYELKWLLDNFRNPHDHSVENIDDEFEDAIIVQAKLFTHHIRKFIEDLEHV